MVRVKPTTEQKAGPMSQPCWRAATVSTGIPNTETSSSQQIRFISSRWNSVRSCDTVIEYHLTVYKYQFLLTKSNPFLDAKVKAVVMYDVSQLVS